MAYDPQGRLSTATVGTGPAARVTSFGFRSEDGYLGTVTGPIPDEQSVLSPDAAGRPLDVQRPDGQHTSMQYDGLGQLRGLTPPSRPTHELAYTPLRLLSDYIAPAATATDAAITTHFDYNHDRKLELVTRPDGRNTDYQYDTQTGSWRTSSAPARTSTSATARAVKSTASRARTRAACTA